MLVFISQSGQLSRSLALLVSEWLPKVLQAVSTWVAAKDIEKGSRWEPEISKRLAETNFGIVCLTSDNLQAPWIHFEAGALAKDPGVSRVWTLLLNVRKEDVPPPLAQFQHTAAQSKGEMKKLVDAVNRNLGEMQLDERRLNDALEKWWPEFEDGLAKMLSECKSGEPEAPKRSEREMIAEVLELVRAMVFELAYRREVEQRTEAELRWAKNPWAFFAETRKNSSTEVAASEKSPLVKALEEWR